MRPSHPMFQAPKTLLQLASACFAAFALLLTPADAQAQASYFYLDRAQISGAPDDGFMVWRPHMHEETRFYGFAALGYTHNPLRDETVTDDSEVENRISDPIRGQIITYLHLGTEVARRVGLNVSMPVMLYKFTTTDPLVAGVGEGGVDGNRVAIHDIRFDGRVMIYESNSRKLRLGLGGALWAPVGNAGAFAGDSALSGLLYGAGEIDFKKFFVSGMIGPHFREERSIGGANGALYTDSELRYAFGAYLPLRGNRIRLGAELWGSTGLAPVGPENDQSTVFGSRNTDIEWLAQVRMLLDKRERIWFMGGGGTRLFTGYGAPDIRLLVSIGSFLTLKDFEAGSPPPKVTFTSDVDLKDPDRDGDGFPDSIDACPDEKEDGKPPNPGDGCPASADRDKDGIPDNVDQCPDQPEDKDGVQDDDGCPEKDADGDGIPDAEDKCPTQAGRKSSNPAKNGCPGFTEVEDGQVKLLKPIEFEFAKAVIKPVSYPILDEVVELMKDQPKMRIGVYGHTDNQGALELNKRLSRERAAACKNYLISKGIAAGRLESQGFGPSQPVADNGSDEGRARNRRVEFKILSE